MKKRIQGMVFGFLLSLLIFGTITVARAATRTIDVTHGINIVVDGVRQYFEDDMQPFTFEGRAFVSVRGFAEALGFDVDWDAATTTAYISTPVPVLDLGGIEIIIGSRLHDWCTDTATPQTAEEEARLQDRIYVQQRYNFRVREVYFGDMIEKWARIVVSVAAGDPIADIVQLDSDDFEILLEEGIFLPLVNDIFADFDDILWHYSTIDITEKVYLPFGWTRDGAAKEDTSINAILWGPHSVDVVMMAYMLWNRPIT